MALMYVGLILKTLRLWKIPFIIKALCHERFSMNSTNFDSLRERLLPQVTTLVESALQGNSDRLVIESLLESCCYLEASIDTKAPIVALEQDVCSDSGTYHLLVRRLKSSVPAGKFQILITRELASGLIY